jgi:hypothetical protein
MAAGPGKYDAECTAARESARAVAAILIVVEGDRGTGFSVQTLEPDLIRVLPTMLEVMAAEIRADAQRRAN